MATSFSSSTSTTITSSLRAHLREELKPKRLRVPYMGQGAAQAGEQGTKSKRSWNALETTAAFGIPLPAVQPLAGDGGAPAPWSLALGPHQNPSIPSPRGQT
ncbi:hypothetical protein P7K49_030400 [Saguinus oedipus]|uniref:Uncharacterized protein n=1 Tax=Saguinus oedipus TaxID=9490 RepID=A0ABQ9U2T6_SAGOE|nr:hypothetical protein P7K49_030400 [Saguinus oedipus]